MTKIYAANSLKKWDDFTIKHTPIESIELMEKAAQTCAKQILGAYIFERISIFCGIGNNGGDGLAIARILCENGSEVTVYLLGDISMACDNSILNYKRLPKGVTVIELSEKAVLTIEADIIIDAIFGSGLNRAVNGWIGAVIDQINQYQTPVIAIDLPSGLFADDNRENDLSHCIQADLTLTIQVPKMSFFYAEYDKYIGKFILIDINLLPDFTGDSIAVFVDKKSAQLKEKSKFIYKGDKGFLTIIGGFNKMTGAIILSAKAGFRTGCGYVGVISDETSFSPLMCHLPEAIWLGTSLESLSYKTNVIAVGPGLGQTTEALDLLKSIFNTKHPLVIDADAINLIAKNPSLKNELPAGSILTPHLGELERLIGAFKSPEERLEKQLAFSRKQNVYIIQKGAFSKLTTPEGCLYINSTGNNGMATAGMGDALTGMIGAFLAQGYAPIEAAINGMFYHGLAGDLGVKKNGTHGFLTSDLIESIPTALNEL